MKFMVLTETGSRHAVDGERKVYWRVAREEGGEALRRDGEELTLLQVVAPPQVGEPLSLLLEGLSGVGVTVRITAPVVEIMPLPDGAS